MPPGFADGIDDASVVVSGTQVYAGEGLTRLASSDAVTLSLALPYRLPQTCANGQIAEWNGAAWVCGNDDTGNGDHNHLGQTWTGDANSLVITGTFDQVDDPAPLVLGNTAPYGEGLWVRSEGGDGVAVARADDAGVRVRSAGGAGVAVNWAGDASAAIFSSHNDGFQVAGAAGNGLYVGQADMDGVRVNSARLDGVHIDSAGADGVEVDSAGGNGIDVDFAGFNGVDVYSAGNNGVYVSLASEDGVHVYEAGNPSVHYTSPYSNGFEVTGAEGYGLYVGRADRSGVLVYSMGGNGVYVGVGGYKWCGGDLNLSVTLRWSLCQQHDRRRRSVRPWWQQHGGRLRLGWEQR